MNRVERDRLLALALAGLAALLVLVVSLRVFPYHSANHDEGVYLQQAAMLADGQLFMYPGDLASAFRPWFFVVDGGRMYPKYAPVPAAVFAAGELVGGSYRLSLAAVAAANVLLTYGTVAEAFDRRTGLLAAGLLLVSPLFLIDSALFLPYAPTAMFDLAFALCYLRARRLGSRGYALLAGVAVGIAFFARPYTAVLFATPFAVHAVATLARDRSRAVVERTALLAAAGLAFVALTLAYNAVVTGSPLTFPYEAFAPRDGLGFGEREILGHEVRYDPELALRANAAVLAAFVSRWFAGGLAGVSLFAVGLGAFVRRGRDAPRFEARAMLAGLLVAIPLGNVYFWGNLNILGRIADPTDGLVSLLGPYYHFDLLLPAAAFAAHGAVVLGRLVRGRLAAGTDPTRARTVRRVLVLVALVLVAASGAAATAPKLAANERVTAQYERAYEPFEDRSFENALVFLPTPYGDWLNHPFQALRNGPDLDGPVVYAIDDERTFDVIDAYPNRTLYRYSYRGEWAPTLGRSVEPRLREIRAVSGGDVAVTTVVGVPADTRSVSIRLAAGDRSAYYTVESANGTATLAVRLDPRRATIGGPSTKQVGERDRVPIADEERVTVELFLDRGPGSELTYRAEIPVLTENGTVRALTPYTERCLIPRRCGGEAAAVGAGDPDQFIRTRLAVGNRTAPRARR